MSQLLAGCDLDPDCPVNWDWEGNTGLLAEWAVAPVSGWRGTPKITDLTRGKHAGVGGKPNDGALNGGVTWQGASRPGGYGQLSFDGASGSYVDCGATVNSPNPGITIVALLKSTSSTLSPVVLNKNFDGSFVPYSLSIRTSGIAYPGFAFFDGSWRNSGGTTDIRGDNLWHYVAGDWDGTTARYILDGKVDASGTPGGTRSTAGTGHATIGAYLNDAVYFPGLIACVLIFDRALSIGQHQALSDQLRRGNPDRWRWLSRAAWFLPAGAAVATPHLLSCLGVGA